MFGKVRLMTPIPLPSCRFEKICFWLGEKKRVHSDGELFAKLIVTCPGECKILYQGMKREDPGNEDVM